MPRVIRSAAARQDLKEIARYIAQTAKSKTPARKWVAEVISHCAIYASHPEAGEACNDVMEGLRRFVVGSYVVYYRRIRNDIELVRVLHGALDITMLDF